MKAKSRKQTKGEFYCKSGCQSGTRIIDAVMNRGGVCGSEKIKITNTVVPNKETHNKVREEERNKTTNAPFDQEEDFLVLNHDK